MPPTIDDSVCRHCIKALSRRMRVINVCISSSVHSIQAARSDRFIGGQLSERMTAGPAPAGHAVCGNISESSTSTIKARATCCVYNKQASTSSSSTSASTSDTASSPDRKKAKLDSFADVRNYTAPSTGALLHATSAAELAEYKSMSAPAVGPLEFWRQKADQAADYVLHRQAFFCVCLRARPNPSVTTSGRTVTEMRSRLSAEKVEALELVRSGMRLGDNDT